MARIDPIPLEAMTQEQKRINDEIAGSRGGGTAKGPFALWLRTPELADLANAFGSHLRHHTSVPQRLVELAVLVVARTYTAQYEWYAHAKYVEQVGLDPAVAEAIRSRTAPVIEKEDEKIVYAVASELSVDRRLSDPTYAKAVETLGEQTVLDLVTIIGFYTMVAVVLVSIDVDIPDGGPKPLSA
jgi:4-carboxymuconolactone decarboxylase